MKFGIAAHRHAGLMVLILAIASGCGPGGERTDNEPKPAATNRPVSRPEPKRPARDSDPAHANGIGTPTNPVPTTPSLQSSSSIDLATTRTKAESGDVAAQTALGNYYATGQGGRIELAEALKCHYSTLINLDLTPLCIVVLLKLAVFAFPLQIRSDQIRCGS